MFAGCYFDVGCHLTRNLTEGVVNDTEIKVVLKEEKSSFVTEERMRKLLLDSDSFESSAEGRETESESVNFEEEASSTDELGEDVDVSFEDVVSGKIKPNEKQVQKLVKKRRGWPLFKEVFMVSALEGFGVEDVRNFLINSSKKGNWIFNEDVSNLYFILFTTFICLPFVVLPPFYVQYI